MEHRNTEFTAMPAPEYRQSTHLVQRDSRSLFPKHYS